MRWLDGYGFGWVPRVGDGQGGLVCCSPWGCKESDTTYTTTGKTIAFTRRTFVGKVMSLLLNMLSRLVILKSRDSTLPTKVHLVKAMVFPVVMYGCQSWTVEG